jgi:hypothetical protein
MRYLVQLSTGERATERGYNAWASGQGGAFYAGAFQLHHGGWSKVRNAAWARLRQEGGGARPPVSTSAAKPPSLRRRLRRQ